MLGSWACATPGLARETFQAEAPESILGSFPSGLALLVVGVWVSPGLDISLP